MDEHFAHPGIGKIHQGKGCGLFNNVSEIIREALRESLRRESENQWLQREVAIGFAQLEAGQVVRVDSKEDFLAALRMSS